MQKHLDQAIHFAQAHEVKWPREPATPLLAGQLPFGVHHGDPPPWNRLRGPVHGRGAVSGVVWQAGREIASWGEPDRADLTFSVAKTYLALLAGVAHDRGLLPDPHEPVAARVPGIGFDDPHNGSVTWNHLLQQTSEWSGNCLGLPDTVDRYRKVAHDPRPVLGRKGDARPLHAPGHFWEYNDVRINQLALALLHLFGQPLPEVFEQTILLPLGAGAQWHWAGYDDAWMDLVLPDGRIRRVQSVPGGSHWGGGVSISARDQARIGQLLLNGGRHGERQLVSAQWLAHMREPCALAPFYGWLVWLNGGGALFPGASEDSYFMVGAGGHYVWIDPRNDAVVVVRWLDPEHAGAFIAEMGTALERMRQGA